jgi:hypothetical protein
MRAMTRTEYQCGFSLVAAINAACWLWQPVIRHAVGPPIGVEW